MGTDVQEKDRRENRDVRATVPRFLSEEKILELGGCQLRMGVEGDMTVRRGAPMEEQFSHVARGEVGWRSPIRAGAPSVEWESSHSGAGFQRPVEEFCSDLAGSDGQEPSAYAFMPSPLQSGHLADL